MIDPDAIQHINLKIFAEDAGAFDLAGAVAVFHQWIRDSVCLEMLVDVADYRHVPAGPGVMVIGLQADYSVDNTDDRLGVRYNRKAGAEGSNQDRLRQAARAALTSFQRLESDPRLGGKLRFNGQDLEIFINDRALAPNDAATREAADPELKEFAHKLFQGSGYSLAYESEPRRLFGVSLKAARAFSVADLLKNLA